jgi:hypothetical protein
MCVLVAGKEREDIGERYSKYAEDTRAVYRDIYIAREERREGAQDGERAQRHTHTVSEFHVYLLESLSKLSRCRDGIITEA